MSQFQIEPIDAALCEHVRRTRTDPIFGYDYDVRVSVAGPTGYGPCRQCLKTFSEGERRLLFLHNPFGARLGDYAAPVFIHESSCEPFTPRATLPDELLVLPLLLRSYDKSGHFVDEKTLADGDVSALLDNQFTNEVVDVVHLRNIEAKCYVARVVRVNGAGTDLANR
jgi:hypothetical protein